MAFTRVAMISVASFASASTGISVLHKCGVSESREANSGHSSATLSGP